MTLVIEKWEIVVVRHCLCGSDADFALCFNCLRGQDRAFPKLRLLLYR